MEQACGMAYNGFVQCSTTHIGNGMNRGSLSFSSLSTLNDDNAKNAHDHFTVRVKELSERNRRHLLTHFLGLNDDDRLLRFGAALSDQLIVSYVQSLNFSRDKVFGVYDDRFALVGAGHLAFAPRDAMPALSEVTEKERIAELGVSVSASARGHGIGTRLFARAAIHCRNADVDTLTMHCLASNQKMIHIAKKAGMDIRRTYGDADAYLTLRPADPASMMQEAMQEQAAVLDYTFKAHVRAVSKLLSGFSIGRKK